MGVAHSEPDHASAEIELAVRDSDCFFVEATARADCEFELEDVVHRTDGRLIEFFTVRDGDPELVVERAAGATGISEARMVSRERESALLQFVVDGPCVVGTLADVGAITRSVVAVGGEGRVVAVVPPHVDVRSVVERFSTRHPESELLARRQRNRPWLRTDRSFRTDLLSELTDRQRETLQTAYLSGYFDWPRDSSAADCAAALDIAQPTFSQHLRESQRRLAASLFDGRTDA